MIKSVFDCGLSCVDYVNTKFGTSSNGISVVYEGLNGSENLMNNLTLIYITWIHSQVLKALIKSVYPKNNFLFLNQSIWCGYSKEPSQ